MNTFLPQSTQTKVEILELAGVNKQIISPANSYPIITYAQDSIIGLYLMTRDEKASSGENLFHHMMPIIPLKGTFNILEARKKDFLTGKEMFNMIIPDINYNSDNVKEMIMNIIHQYGPTVCRDFLDNLQRLVISWMEVEGFTIGFGDTVTKNEITEDIDKIINESKKENDELIRRAQIGLFEPFLSNKLKMQALELQIENIGSNMTRKICIIVNENIRDDNNFIRSVKSGAKGQATNLNQIIGLVGQQSIDSKRIVYGWSGRTLPHFTKWDPSLASRGFVFNSFVNGMTPQEFFFASMGTRSGSIAGNIKTAVTGYISRKLVKAMEDLSIKYDGTVRDPSGNIYQLVYGGDNFDPVHLEHVKFDLITMNNHVMNKEYYWDELPEDLFTSSTKLDKKSTDLLLLEEWNQLLKDRSDLRNLYYKYEELESILSPFNLPRVIHQMVKDYSINDELQTDLLPSDVIYAVRDLIKYLTKYTHNDDSAPIIKTYIRTFLSSKRMILKYRFPKNIFMHLIELLRAKILKSTINPGENVGIIAAQSIGEPLTQMVLSTFHFAGIGEKQVFMTAGVPRVLEIINISQTKTPSMKIFLKPEFSRNKKIVDELKNYIEFTTIKDLLLTSEILYLPDKSRGKYPEEEKEFKIFNDIIELTETQCPAVDSLSNWVLWMEFDREIILRKNISMKDIYIKITEILNVDTDISCIVSNMNSEHLTLRIRIKRDLEDGDDYIAFFKNIGNHILDIKLRGIDNIAGVEIDKTKRISYESVEKTEELKNKNYLADHEEWILVTEGSNLIDILSNDYVDIERTTTNDLLEIYDIFGIEGLRYAIYKEIDLTVYQSIGKHLNERHIELLADMMTASGEPVRIHRNGFGVSDRIGPLGRASFEVMDKILINAGIFAEKDDMKGISANVMTCQDIKTGTGTFNLFMNKDLLPAAPIEEIETKSNVDDNKLDAYMKNIGSQTSFADDSDFNFGYNVLNMTEHSLPENPESIFEINILKSTENVRNKKKRKR